MAEYSASVKVGDEVVEIARSEKTIEVEGNQYFPPTDVHKDYLQPSEHHTICPWKGRASYKNVVLQPTAGQEIKLENAAWYYPEPSAAAAEIGIRGYYAFWNGVDVKQV